MFVLDLHLSQFLHEQYFGDINFETNFQHIISFQELSKIVNLFESLAKLFKKGICWSLGIVAPAICEEIFFWRVLQEVPRHPEESRLYTLLLHRVLIGTKERMTREIRNAVKWTRQHAYMHACMKVIIQRRSSPIFGSIFSSVFG